MTLILPALATALPHWPSVTATAALCAAVGWGAGRLEQPERTDDD
jgi:hypothetical protein